MNFYLPPARLLACFMFLLGFGFVNAQDYVASAETSNRDNLPSVYRYHKKISATYDGFAVEIATSEYPMERTEPVFRKFGKVFYHKLRKGGYSYVILLDFGKEKEAAKFCKNVIAPKVERARLIEYDQGERKVVENK